MASIKDGTNDGTNRPTDELNNLIGAMFLFYKENLIIENISGNKHIFKTEWYLDIW